MFIIFFIPEAVLAVIGVLALIGILFLGENITNICEFCTNNFWIFIVLTIILVLVIATLYAAEYDVISAIALVFASSQLLVLFLDTLYDIFSMGHDFMGNGWLGMLIVAPILIAYVVGNLYFVFWGIESNAKKDSTSMLWCVGIVGWLLNFFVFS